MSPPCYIDFTYKRQVQIMTHIKSVGLWVLIISLNGGGGTIPLSGRQEKVAWIDNMTYLIINYSWHLSFLRGSDGVSDHVRVCLQATALVSLRRRKNGVHLVKVYT